MNSVLFLVSKSAQSWPDYQFILNPGQNNAKKIIVLLEGTGAKGGISADQVFHLDEAFPAKVTVSGDETNSTTSPISYRDLLDLIFSSDHSVVV